MDDFDFTPVFREEQFIDAILNGTTPPEPVYRREYYLAKAAGKDVSVPTPVFRDEMFLAKIAGESVDLPEPVTREEKYLAKIAGEDVEVPDPAFRDEYWLSDWAGGGSSSVQKTVSGAVIHITDALAAPAVALSAAINPVQDLHGYDNPWPAGGGKNLCPDKKYEVPTNDSLYPGQDNGTDFPFSFTAGVTYTLSFTAPSGWGFTVYTREANASSGTMVAANKQQPISFTPTVTGTYRIAITRTGLKATDISNIQVEQSSTATAFAPYENICPITGSTEANIAVSPTQDAQDGTTYTVSFGTAGTVYGGTLDVVNGTLTIDHQMFLFDSSDTGNWTVNNNNYFQRRRPTGFSETSSDAWPKKFYSNALETTTRSGSAGNIQFNSFYAGSTYLAVRIDSFNHDLTTFQNFLSNTGLQIVVPIEETTVQLTPTEVQLLLGENYVWADTGNVELTYLADGRMTALGALNLLLGGMYTPSADVPDNEALQIIMGETT